MVDEYDFYRRNFTDEMGSKSYSQIASDDYFGRMKYIYHKYVFGMDHYDFVDYAATLDDVYTFMGVDRFDQPFHFYDTIHKRRDFIFNEKTLKYLFCDKDYTTILPAIEESLKSFNFTAYRKTAHGHLLVRSSHFHRFLDIIYYIIGGRFEIAFIVKMFIMRCMQEFRTRYDVVNGQIVERTPDTEDELLWESSDTEPEFYK